MINTIVTGNNVEVLKGMAADSVDLILTSPPYDDIRTYKTKVACDEKYGGFSFDFNGLAPELFRVLKPGGILVWVVGDAVIGGGETGNSFRQALKFIDVGFLLHDTMIYEKNTSSFPARKNGTRYTQIFEYMFVLSKGKPTTANLICDKENKWAGFTNWGKKTSRTKNNDLQVTSDIKPVPKFSARNNIWRYVVGGGFASKDKEAHQHPAIFPEKLAEDHISTWTNEGDVVLDPFVGSGTTTKMAAILKRKFIGIDISDEYAEIAKNRTRKYYKGTL
jgi:DNA modification methylase